MLKRLCIVVLGLLVLRGPAVCAEEVVKELTLFAGQVATIPAKGVKRVAVGNGALLTTTVLNNGELLLLGEKAGETSLVVWDLDGQHTQYMVRIGNGDTKNLLYNLSILIGDIPGVQINQVGTHVVVSGSASKEGLSRIAAVAKMYPQVTNLASEEEVSMKRMVYMKVQIIEMKRSLSEKIGLQWPNSFDGPMAGVLGNLGSNKAATQAPLKGVLPVSNQGLRAYLGVSTLIQSTLNLAKSNGDAYVLAEPELSSRSGGSAKFLAGGQIPLPSTSSLGAGSVDFKDYGIRLTIRPDADNRGNIRAQISTEISSIDPAIAVNNIPGFLTRTTESEVNMRAGQTMVMSGLVSADISKDIVRVPGLSKIPVLGRLFESEDFRNSRTDLVILITPNVYDPNSTINRERLEKGMEIRKRFEQRLSEQDLLD